MKDPIRNRRKIQDIVKTLKKIYPSNNTDSTSLNKVYLSELVGGEDQRHSKDYYLGLREHWRQDPSAPSNFKEYIKLIEAADVNSLPKEIQTIVKKENTKNIAYLTEAEAAPLKLTFDHEGLIHKNGQIYNTVGSAEGVGSETPNEAAFVVQNGNIYAKHHIRGEFQHSSAVSGKAVSCAGLITVNNGKITKIVNKSGHYSVSNNDFHHFVTSLDPKFFDPNIKIVDSTRPCYFSNVLDSASNLFIMKFGEKLYKEFNQKVEYKGEALKKYLSDPSPKYKFEVSPEESRQITQDVLAELICREEKIKLPEDKSTHKQIFDSVMGNVDYQNKYQTNEIMEFTDKIIAANKEIINSDLDEATKTKIKEQLSSMLHLKLEVLCGTKDPDMSKPFENSIKTFYEKTINQLKPELASVLRDEFKQTYEEITNAATYTRRDPSVATTPSIAAVYCTEMPDLGAVNRAFDQVISAVDKAGDQDIANQLTRMKNLQHAFADHKVVNKEAFQAEMNEIKAEITSNPKWSKYSHDPELISKLKPMIFVTPTEETTVVYSELLEVFSDQVKAIRIANLRHVAKKGSTLDSSVKFGNYLPSTDEYRDSAHIVAEFETRLEAGYEVIKEYLTDAYIENIYTKARTATPGEDGRTIINVVRPIKDYSDKTNSYNVLTNLTAQILVEKLNERARKDGANIDFRGGETQMLTTTNRTDADPIGRIIKQPYFNDASSIAKQNVIIFDDHMQAGAFGATLANFSHHHNANIIGVVTLTGHPTSATSLYANPQIVDYFHTVVKDVGQNGKPLDQEQALRNMDSLLARQGMSLDTLTNTEALICCALFMPPEQIEDFKKLETLASGGINIRDGQKDSIISVLQDRAARKNTYLMHTNPQDLTIDCSTKQNQDVFTIHDDKLYYIKVRDGVQAIAKEVKAKPGEEIQKTIDILNTRNQNHQSTYKLEGKDLKVIRDKTLHAVPAFPETVSALTVEIEQRLKKGERQLHKQTNQLIASATTVEALVRSSLDNRAVLSH